MALARRTGIEVWGVQDTSGDADADGYSDLRDACPETAGPSRGCPDTDNDGIGDADDSCPTDPGSVAAQGCPDGDNDGVNDTEDMCPNEAGATTAQGCPDADGDGVQDATDSCPNDAGLAEMSGCLYTGTVTSGSAVNLREGPGTTFNVVGQLVPNAQFTIFGRNEAGDWLQIRTIPADGETVLEAWIYVNLISTDADINTLPIIP